MPRNSLPRAALAAARRGRLAACLLLLILPALGASAAPDDAALSTPAPLPRNSQNTSRSESSEDLFFAALAEAGLNARRGLAGGGGAAVGFGDGTALGGKFLFNGGGDSLRVMEAALFFRCYLPSLRGHRGFFAQGEFGQSMMYEGGRWTGTFLGGLTLGWRFLFGDHWYAEPVLRAGYPFIAGGGIAAGFRL